jgi:hypothetical protein
MTNMRDTAAVGPGWLDIVIECDLQLEALDPGYTIHQVKEKFGGLRYYYGVTENATKEIRLAMDEVVRGAEEIAAVTCEECGNPGEFRSSNPGWMRTLCDPCEAARAARRAAMFAITRTEDENG